MKQYLLLSLLITSFFFAKPTHAAVNDWQKGASVIPYSQTDFGTDAFKQTVQNLKNDGINYIIFIIPYYQPDAHSSDIRRGWNTPTDDSLIQAIDYVHSQGMHVVLKFHPEIDSGEWRANINPDDRQAWFNRYTDILRQYGQLAKDHNVEGICIGAEMIDLVSDSVNSQNSQYWRGLIAELRKVFPGFLTYSMQWDGSDESIFADLDYIGLAGYFPLATNDNPSVDDLKGAWDYWNNKTILPLQQKYNKPIIFTEIGYKNVQGANLEPWMSWKDTGFDEDLQAHLYQAMFEYWNTKDYVKGMYIWSFKPDPNAGGSNDKDYTPQNKKAEQTMKSWFTNNLPPSPSVSVSMTPTPTPMATTYEFDQWRINRPPPKIKIKEKLQKDGRYFYHFYQRSESNTSSYHYFHSSTSYQVN